MRLSELIFYLTLEWHAHKSEVKLDRRLAVSQIQVVVPVHVLFKSLFLVDCRLQIVVLFKRLFSVDFVTSVNVSVTVIRDLVFVKTTCLSLQWNLWKANLRNEDVLWNNYKDTSSGPKLLFSVQIALWNEDASVLGTLLARLKGVLISQVSLYKQPGWFLLDLMSILLLFYLFALRSNSPCSKEGEKVTLFFCNSLCTLSYGRALQKCRFMWNHVIERRAAFQ
jgi:hypothetical protein